MTVFVYGSLKRGEGNHWLLREDYYVRKAITRREFDLYDLGGFPAAVAGGNNAIVGEIYDISNKTLINLDILESHPDFYKREIVTLQDGEQVYMYLLNSGDVSGSPIVKSGEWTVDKSLLA